MLPLLPHPDSILIPELSSFLLGETSLEVPGPDGRLVHTYHDRKYGQHEIALDGVGGEHILHQSGECTVNEKSQALLTLISPSFDVRRLCGLQDLPLDDSASHMTLLPFAVSLLVSVLHLQSLHHSSYLFLFFNNN